MGSGFADIARVVPTSLVGHEGELVTAAFSYRADDPFAVVAEFVAGGTHIEWTFARELLLDGLSFATGEGDILVAPVSVDEIELTLRSPDGSARLRCDRAAVQSLVDQSYALVPAGAENSDLAVDLLLAELAL